MNFALIVTSVILLGLSGLKDNPKDFDSELSYIAKKFVLEIMNKDECIKLKRAADDLGDDIKDEINKTAKYSPSEIAELKKLKKEAEALEYYISVVGNCGSDISSIENFNLTNKRVGASVTNVIKGKYCVDVISVNIGDYVAFLVENNTNKNYTVSYKWKSANGLHTGNGTMGLTKSSIRHIYDNRDEPQLRNISVSGITCKEF